MATGLSSNLGIVSSSGCITSMLDPTEISNAYFVCHCNNQEDVLKMHVLCVCEHIAGFCAYVSCVHVCATVTHRNRNRPCKDCSTRLSHTLLAAWQELTHASMFSVIHTSAENL